MKPVTETRKKGIEKTRINWFVDRKPERNI